ncbi:MAG: serine/threonine-protein kinase [Planctomycetota bacterium]|nr:serine/threonine-protein kinase [Planctomycetota bacterium]
MDARPDDMFAMVKSLFAELRGLPEAERSERLRDVRARSETVADEVAALLRHHDAATSVLSGPEIGELARRAALAASLDADAGRARAEEREGAEVGPYTLVRPIGEGGFGSVWLARQRFPVEREVALKIVKAGMDTRAMLRRFDAERRTLAAMEHPGIARMFDAGETASGRPFFVMEFVRGEPLTAYCDGRRLGVRQRLELFIDVCRAVQHAHQKGVIHRDLKPGNILVEEVDGRAAPKVIDFCIVKVSSGESEAGMTLEGQPIGTPEYMSPEQLDASRDIDTRADVYSLGVILYELAAGVLPFDSAELRGGGLERMRRIIREVDAPRPVSRLGAALEQREGLARDRGADHASHRRALRGDVEWIIMRAIEKDRERRYGSPAELAAEIRRHLDDEPVLAGPPGAAYRARKFVKRHRVGAVAAGAMLLALAGGAGLAALGFVRAERERDRAVREAATSGAINEFLLQRMLAATDPENFGREVRVIDVLDAALRERSASFKDQPDVLADVELVLGETYDALGVRGRALELLTSAAESRRSRLGPDDERTLEAECRLAQSLLSSGEVDRARPMVERLWARVEGGARGLSAGSVRAIRAARATLLAAEGRYDDSLALSELNASSAESEFGPAHPDTLRARTSLLSAVVAAGRFERAAQMAEEHARLCEASSGPDHPSTIRALIAQADTLSIMGEHERSERVARGALERAERAWGVEHQAVSVPLNAVGLALREQRRQEEAQAAFRRAIAVLERTAGSEHPWTLTVRGNLANSLQQAGRHEEAEALLRSILDVRTRTLGAEHPEVASTMEGIALTYAGRGRFAEAAALQREAAAMQGRFLRRDHPTYLNALANLGSFLREAGEHAEAARTLREVAEIEEQTLGPTNAYVAMDYRSLAQALVGAGAPEEALEAARRAVSIAEGHHADDLALRTDCAAVLAEALTKLGRATEARDVLARLHPELAADGARSRQARRVAGMLAELSLALNEPEEAERWRALAQEAQAPAEAPAGG